MAYMDRPMQKCHSIIITGKVQDIGFRSIVEHIGRSFGLPGFVFNSKDGSVNILCSGEDTVIDNFKQEIKARGAANGAEIVGIKEQTLSININLPENFTKASADDDIDIGRKLDKANLLLKTGFNNLNTDLNAGFNKLTDMLGTFIIEQKVYNRGQQEHNTRLEAILEKLASK
jgi:acylphosphatase